MSNPPYEDPYPQRRLILDLAKACLPACPPNRSLRPRCREWAAERGLHSAHFANLVLAVCQESWGLNVGPALLNFPVLVPFSKCSLRESVKDFVWLTQVTSPPPNSSLPKVTLCRDL